MLGLFFSSYPEIDPKDEELNFRNSLTTGVCDPPLHGSEWFRLQGLALGGRTGLNSQGEKVS